MKHSVAVTSNFAFDQGAAAPCGVICAGVWLRHSQRRAAYGFAIARANTRLPPNGAIGFANTRLNPRRYRLNANTRRFFLLNTDVINVSLPHIP